MTIGASPLMDHVKGPVNIDSMTKPFQQISDVGWTQLPRAADSSRVSYNQRMGETCVFEGLLAGQTTVP